MVIAGPGTGKTQVAHYLAWHLGLEDRLYQLDVRSSTTAAVTVGPRSAISRYEVR